MKKSKNIFFLLTTLLLLTSCNIEQVFTPYTFPPLEVDTTSARDLGAYKRAEPFTKSFYDVLTSGDNSTRNGRPMRAVGEQKILVLPVNFPDYNLNSLDGKNGDKALVNIENAFFGENEETSWRSVSGFYHESSYGKLKVRGEVAPWYTLPAEYSIENLNTRVRGSSEKINETSRISALAVREFERLYPAKIADYDTDNDGYIDSVYLIYSAPYAPKDNNNIFWAFAAYKSTNDGSLSKQVNAYAWSSYHFLAAKSNRKVDAHTFIHEVGHLFGLSDYYNTSTVETYNPLGGFDLMDFTLGYHSGLSKMMLDWTYPLVMKESGEVVLRPFTTTGDLLLLKNNWNKNATDEYLLLEYYTPFGLNEKDSSLNAAFKLPKASGLKVYHVDARTVYEIKSESVTRYEYSNNYNGEFNGRELLAHSNTTGSQNGAPKRDFVLYKLLEPKERTHIGEEHQTADVKSLFTKGDDFGSEYYQNFTFNDGSLLNYKFSVTSVNKDGITLKVEVI